MIEVRGLTKRYGEVLAVDDLTFAVRPGEVTGFLGPNGAGKSTTLRMVLGLDAASSGTATVGGRPYATQPAPLKAVGALLDPGAVLPSRTAYHHVLALAAGNGIPRGRVNEVLAEVGLEKVSRRRTGTFSLGMRQRLGIAAALLGDPPVLIFDEPLNGLDPEGIVWIRSLMRKMAAEGRAVLMSSHLMTEMERTADHLIVIGRGKLIADMTMKDFIEAHSRREVLVRTPQAHALRSLLAGAVDVRAGSDDSDGNDDSGGSDDTLIVTGLEAPEIGALASAGGIELHELSPRQVSLEAAFMQLTHDAVEYQADKETDR
ncbi:ABC-2 type transport system ATP-binding protein [Streptomyces aurantiacus]|uniref:ABC transporter ATP-binding protein n=1 Tax=Streptomyces aurantiacus TaxID=47760 RepID=UPI00278EB1DA|nr:ATP-binding cassette domain-containing protein [Streptomyces aurantiacus]MDQ0775556.1 ABC-2 type transport system ATP-binding protein [Streptomyces aurantiacus]